MKIKVYEKNGKVIRIETIKQFSKEIFELEKDTQINDANGKGENIRICKVKEQSKK